MELQHIAVISDNFINLFNKKVCEKHVLNIMNLSTIIFPNHYHAIDDQSHGECDFIDLTTSTKYDAKLPFLPNQIELLTSGKKHSPLILDWIKEMHAEAADYNPFGIRSNPNYNVLDTKLGQIMKNAIQNDNVDENIIFFIPYPISLSVEDSIFLQFAGDYLSAIFDGLSKEFDFESRSIFVIYPSSRKNIFALRNLKCHRTEFIVYENMEEYFSYKIVG